MNLLMITEMIVSAYLSKEKQGTQLRLSTLIKEK
jgi:predicted transcriptional regulator